MALNNLDLDALEIFRTVATEGGITRAAQRLNRVQSNISTRIIQLEERLNVTLFNRVSRRLELTAEGKLLLTYADRLLQLAEETEEVFKGGIARGSFRLGSMESTAAARLPELLSTYHSRCPQVQMELVTDTTASLIAKVANCELEAAFVAGPVSQRALSSPHSQQELSTQLAFRENLVLIAPRSKNFTQAQDAVNEHLITFRAGCAYRNIVENWLIDQGGTVKSGMEMSSYHAIVACVAAGTGVALVPESVLQVITIGKMIQRLPLPAKYANSETLLIWRQSYQPPKIDVLRQLIQNQWDHQATQSA